MRAVAPQTVSPGQLEERHRPPHPPQLPDLLAARGRVEQVRERHRERGRDLARVGPEDRRHGEQADDRRDRELRGDGAQLSSSATTSTASGSSPISSWASRSAAATTDASLGSRLPPGNAISPRCDGIVSGRLVSTTCASPPSSNSATSTAAARLVGEWSSDARGGGQRQEPVANVGEREVAQARIEIDPRGRSPGRTAGGRGMTWRPPAPVLARRGRPGGSTSRSPAIGGRLPTHWHATTTPGGRWRSSGTSRDCWEAIADAQPDRPALVQGDRIRSWAEWEDRSARLAAAFKDLGLTEDGKVASYLYNSIEYMEGVFATWKCGGAPVNVNYRYLEEELEYLLANSDTEILLFHGVARRPGREDRREDPDAEGVHPGRRRLAARRGRAAVRGPDRGPRARAAQGDAERRRPLHPLHRWHHGDAQGRHVAQRRPVHVAVPFVYGSRVRRFPRTARRVRGTIAARVEAAGSTPVHLPASPLMHGTGFMSSLQALTMGGTIVTLESRNFDPDELWRAVEQQRRHPDGDRRRRVRQADGAGARAGRGGRQARTTSRRSASSSARA